MQNYLAGEEFEHLRNKLESDRICNRGFWEKNVQQENRFFRVLDLLIYLGKDLGGTQTLFQDFVKISNFQKLFISSC